MLCKTDHSCSFLSWIALGKDLPVNFASIITFIGAALVAILVAEQ